jgi:hypothetical protein
VLFQDRGWLQLQRRHSERTRQPAEAVFPVSKTSCIMNFLFLFILIAGQTLIIMCNFFCSALNSNKFTGTIPPQIGLLSSLVWLDLADNQLTGSVPVSTGTAPGLNMLNNTEHL